MKQLHEIKKEQDSKLSELFKQCGVFWAFSNEQFAKNKTPLDEGDKYVSIGAGGYLPKSKVDDLCSGMKEIGKWYEETTKDLREENILYELYNHEAFYTGDIESTMDALGEEYTVEEVIKVYNDNKNAAYEAMGF